jgi:hypothetical protein
VDYKDEFKIYFTFMSAASKPVINVTLEDSLSRQNIILSARAETDKRKERN